MDTILIGLTFLFFLLIIEIGAVIAAFLLLRDCFDDLARRK